MSLHSRMRLVVVAAAALAAAAGVIVTAPTATAETDPHLYKYNQITTDWVDPANPFAGLCLDGHDAGNGTRVVLWQCITRSSSVNSSIYAIPAQSWVFDHVAGGLQIRNMTGRCLDADYHGLGYNGNRVQMWDCNGSVQQTWTVIEVNDRFLFVNHGATDRASRRMVLDIEASRGTGTPPTNGVRAQLWEWPFGATPPPNQRFDNMNLDLNYHLPR